VGVKKTSAGFENWVMCVSKLSLIVVSPWFACCCGWASLVATSLLSLYHNRPDSSVASSKDLHSCVSCDTINSVVVLHRVHKQPSNPSKDSGSGALTVQTKSMLQDFLHWEALMR